MQDRIKTIEAELEKLPKGTLVYKTIKGRKQPYLQWTENGKSISKYIKRENRDLIFEQLNIRTRLRSELKELKHEMLISGTEIGNNLFTSADHAFIPGRKPSNIFGILYRALSICPNKTAFSDIERSITYKQLYEESCRIAHEIIKRGVRRSPIAVYLRRSAWSVSCIYGILLSGNFYTIADTEVPGMHLSKGLAAISPALIITDNEHLERTTTFAPGIPAVTIEAAAENEPDMDLIDQAEASVLSSDPMFIMFTSGSSGTPKGAVTSHRAVMSHIGTLIRTFNINQDTIFGSQTPFYFIMSLMELFAGVAVCASTYIIPSNYFVFPGLLVKFIENRKINFLNWVPSVLCLVSNLNAFKAADISCVRTVVFGGEAMPVKQLNKWRSALPGCTFINAYGTTESTNICSYYKVGRDFAENEALPIGAPMENNEFYILDDEGNFVTEGEGELYIHSEALAYGYYNEPEETAASFIQNPANKAFPEIIYKTGDIVRYNDRGELVFVGRKDRQISHMGWRIDLSEIETYISGIPGVRENDCFYDSKKQRIMLVYSGDIDEADIRKHIYKLLPHYMQPQKRIHIPELPHNINGKIDRAAIEQKYLG